MYLSIQSHRISVPIPYNFNEHFYVPEKVFHRFVFKMFHNWFLTSSLLLNHFSTKVRLQFGHQKMITWSYIWAISKDSISRSMNITLLYWFSINDNKTNTRISMQKIKFEAQNHTTLLFNFIAKYMKRVSLTFLYVIVLKLNKNIMFSAK